ncbi:YceI family protein [Robertkochia marina]|uniref:YceI family protein n=1 Tax=Robertkochia marina TaxID=1227945 RepID=A0A4S3M3C6_9FLAO|nr:YceI family protein [Robertkochia marina]THD69199.1 YceI family protein [Robertkochia marina]TRZ47542.1 YceI family protein [Robertkochia marina]
MRALIIFLVITGLLSFRSSTSATADKLVYIKNSSSLSIIGKTNVNTFKCRYDIEEISDPLQVGYTQIDETLTFNSAVLHLQNEYFDCGGKMINSDLHKLLDTPRHPEVTIDLQRVYPHPRIKNNYIAAVSITIAGVSKQYDMFLKVTPEDDLSVKGVLEIMLPDFNLEPPQKALGMIRVKDDLVIEFLLDLVEA